MFLAMEEKGRKAANFVTALNAAWNLMAVTRETSASQEQRAVTDEVSSHREGVSGHLSALAHEGCTGFQAPRWVRARPPSCSRHWVRGPAEGRRPEPPRHPGDLRPVLQRHRLHGVRTGFNARFPSMPSRSGPCPSRPPERRTTRPSSAWSGSGLSHAPPLSRKRPRRRSKRHEVNARRGWRPRPRCSIPPACSRTTRIQPG